MRIWRKTVFFGILSLLPAFCQGGGAGRFYLVDHRTQVPVMCGTVETNWLAGGKTVWTSEPSLPVTWYV